MGQRPDAVDVADRPEALAGAHVLVDLDAVRLGLDADGLEADPLHARAATRRDEQVVAAQLGVVVELEDVVLPLAPRPCCQLSQDELDVIATEDLAESLAQRGSLVRKQVLGTLDERHLPAKPAHGLRHLDANRPAAQREEAARDRLHAGHLAVGPDALELLQAGDGRHDRVGATGQDDVVGGVTGVAYLHHPRPGEAPDAADQVDPVIGEPALLARVGVVGDHEVPPCERGLDVDLGTRSRVARRVHRLAGAQQRLRRDARPVGALATHQLSLHDGDAQSAGRQGRCAVLPWSTTAENDHVVVIGRAHRHLRRLLGLTANQV